MKLRFIATALLFACLGGLGVSLGQSDKERYLIRGHQVDIGTFQIQQVVGGSWETVGWLYVERISTTEYREYWGLRNLSYTTPGSLSPDISTRFLWSPDTYVRDPRDPYQQDNGDAFRIQFLDQVYRPDEYTFIDCTCISEPHPG